ncbi:helix-turn-helix transcriptional regulator [Thalassospiraceae bacterium LMO-SO8]|nr:helix-turn-helix domain-containing protein [Alphaproteobacteria bacterium LMO-S08]WND74398.1 helix-turn-helix transcriptional regulator [Thalassospiraceae bacterium LMO-SO8]
MATDGTDDGKLASHIGARLQALRERGGISRAVTARALGLSVQAYTNREIGLTEVKASEILILSGLFGCDPADLFDGADRIWPGPDIGGGGAAAVFAGEAEDFLRQLARIRDPGLRRSVTEAIRALARAAEEAT